MRDTGQPSWMTLPSRRGRGANARPRPRWWRRRSVRAAVLLVVVASAVTLVVVHRSRAPFDIRGHLFLDGESSYTSLHDPASEFHALDDCEGTGRYTGFGQDNRVDITDTRGGQLARGVVLAAVEEPDPVDGQPACDLTFDVAAVPAGHDHYRVSFYDRVIEVVDGSTLRHGVVLRAADAANRPA